MRVVVVGGSLTGLTCALLLRDAGFDVDVYERSPAPLQGRGVGIVLHPASARYLRSRTSVDLRAVSAAASTHRYVDRDDRVVCEIARRHYFTGYTALYAALAAAFGPASYHLDHRLTGLRQGDGSVRAVFTATGGRDVAVTADLLVGADGISSTVRAAVLPSVRPAYAGYVAWRGVVPEADLPRGLREDLGDALTYYIGRDGHALAYPIPNFDGGVQPGRRLVNLVWYRNVAAGTELDEVLTDRAGIRREVSVPPGHVRDDARAALRAAARTQLPGRFVALAERIEEPFVQVLFDVAVPAMAFDRVCLVGDAAFAVRPHAATATAKGAEDAWRLADALVAARPDVPAGLAAWEPAQLELGRQLLERNRRLGDDLQFHHAWPAGDPELAFGLWRAGDSADMALDRPA